MRSENAREGFVVLNMNETSINRESLTRSVNESSRTVFIVCGKMKAMIATAISHKKKMSKHSE